jgi:DNA-binding response OmpR family regulator
MAILWLLERPRHHHDSLSMMLQGSFAIRCIASLRSLMHLSRLESSLKPDILVIRLEDFPGQALTNVRESLHSAQPQALKVFCGKGLVDSSVQAADHEAFIDIANALSLPFHIHRLAHGVMARKPTTTREATEEMIGEALSFDFESLVIENKITGEMIRLSLKEAKILRLMLGLADRCVSREQIMAHVWPQVKVSKRTIDSHISRLRKRLNSLGLAIESRYGDGYVLKFGEEP